MPDILSRPSISIGTSGWNYPEWCQVFYPEGLPASRWLAFYARHFATLEINATFYRLPSPETVRKWREGVPDSFLFAVKGSRFMTHVKRLLDIEEPLQRFLEVMRELNPKLGPILWQLPPGLAFDAERTERFLKILPSTERHALEARHDSWLSEACLGLLRDYGVAWCIADTPFYPYLEAVTADFVYARLHGHEQLYTSCYSPEELGEWAEKIRRWAGEGSDVYLYFDNTAYGHAVENAHTLQEMLADIAPPFNPPEPP